MAVQLVNYDNLDTWLSQQPNNTVDTPYELQILTPSSGSDIKSILQDYPNKYVDLRYTLLSKSTDNCNFKNCLTLIGAPKCESMSSKPQFEGCTNLKYVNHVSYDNLDDIFKGCTSLIDAGTIYNSRWNGTRDVYGTSMQSTFEGCINLKSVIIEDSHNALQNISNAFKNCTSLEESPELPSGITDMYGTFTGCVNLKEPPIIPNSVTSLDTSFCRCESLVNAPVIPDSVTSLANTFRECYSLVNAPVIPDSVTYMNSTFNDCSRLERAPVIPNSVTSMDACFRNCTSLAYKPIIPSSVTSAKYCYTFVTQTNWGGSSAQIDEFIPTVNSECEVYEIVPDTDNNCYEPTGRTVYCVDISNLNTWLSEHPVNTISTAYEICIINLTTSNLTDIKTALTGNDTKFVDLQMTQFPSGIPTLANCFQNCESLIKSPAIPSTVNNLSYTYKGCTSLVTIPEIPNGVTNLSYTFYGTNITTTPNIPNTVLNMEGTFQNCTHLNTVTNLPTSVTDMSKTFYGCYNIETVPNIPNSVTNMFETFAYCTRLKTAPSISTSCTILQKTFYNCVHLENAPAIPNSVLNMERAFWNCPEIKTVNNIPSRVFDMTECFYACSSLEEIAEFGIPLNTLKNNSNFQNMFYGCTSLKTIGYKIKESDKWHIFRLKFGQNTVEGKVYDESGNATDINGGTAVSITKDTLTLPVKTDEIWFPNSEQDSEIDDIIEDVIENHYTYYKKTVIPPDEESFVLLAKDPNNVITNIGGGGGTVDTAMSDSSTNAVQNKVIKSYVDNNTTKDTAMSDSSTNAVQNRVIKSYVDTNVTNAITQVLNTYY